MTTEEYLVVGGALLLLASLTTHARERSWFPPSMVFFGAFFLHAFVDPVIRFGSASFNSESWVTLTLFNILAFCAALAGYAATPGLKPKPGHSAIPPSPRDMFGRTSFWIVTLLTIGLLLVQFVGANLLGLFAMAKGFYGYFVPTSVTWLNRLFFPLYILVPAILLAAYTDRYAGSKPYTRAGLFVLALLLFYALGRLARQMIFAPLLTTLIIVHFRIFRLTRSKAWLIAIPILVLGVSGASLLTRAGTGLLRLSLSDVVYLMRTGVWSLPEILNSLGKILPGQEVLANVIQLVDQRGTFGGSTYLNSLLEKVSFGLIHLGDPAPSVWYLEAMGFAGEGHGFDYAMTAEAFLNFGFAGFLVFAPIGLLLGLMSRTVRETTHPVALVWAAFMIVNLVISLRTDSVGFLTRALYFILPLIVLRSVLSFMLRRPTSPEPTRNSPVPACDVGTAQSGAYG
jgi:oligosaccharide repeat unit polymerase